MQRNQKTTLALAAAFAFSLAALPAVAADNPFAAKNYTVAAADKAGEAKCGQAKCGEGKCGAAMGMGDTTKAEPGKTTADKAATVKTKAKAKAKTKAGDKKCAGMGDSSKAESGKTSAEKAAPPAAEMKCGGSKK